MTEKIKIGIPQKNINVIFIHSYIFFCCTFVAMDIIITRIVGTAEMVNIVIEQQILFSIANIHNMMHYLNKKRKGQTTSNQI